MVAPWARTNKASNWINSPTAVSCPSGTIGPRCEAGSPYLVSSLEKTKMEFEEALASAPDADFVVLPGVPDTGVDYGYPPLTESIVQALANRGARVEFVEQGRRAEIDHFAADIWVPVLLIMSDLSLGIAGGLLAEAIVEVIDKRGRHTIDGQGLEADGEPPILHAKVARVRGDELDVLELSGPSDAVLRALRDWDDEVA